MPASRVRLVSLYVPIAILVMGSLSWWALMIPKIGSASMEEAQRIVPAELLATDPINPEAIERGKEISVELQALGRDVPNFEKLQDAAYKALGDKAFDSQENWAPDPALGFVAKESDRLRQLRSTLQSGPAVLAQSQNPTVLFSELRGVMDFERSLCWCARVMAKIGRREEATDLLVTALWIADRAYESSTQSEISNLIASLDQDVAQDAVRRVTQAVGLTPPECMALLAAMPPAPEPDLVRLKVIRTEFQREVLPVLLDPNGKEGKEYLAPRWYMNCSLFDEGKDSHKHAPALRGSYDPIATIRAQAQITQTYMKNLRQPFAKFDPSGDRIASQLSDGLPGLWEYSPDNFWDRMKERYRMVTGHNTLGRQLIASFDHSSRDRIESGCELRAQWNMTRVLLAAQVYSASHGGKLPATTSGFSSILGAWPTSPFTGSPMLYNPARGVVDAGDVESGRGNVAIEVGLNLRPAHPARPQP